MTLATAVGLMRLPLALLAVLVLVLDTSHANEITAVATVLAMASGSLDGPIARKQNTVSVFGVFLDLTLDKAYFCPVFYLVAGSDPTLQGMAGLITVREFLVMGLRCHAAAAGLVLRPRPLGRLKAIVVFLALFTLLLEIPGGTLLMAVGTCLALLSGAEYFVQAWQLLRPELSLTETHD